MDSSWKNSWHTFFFLSKLSPFLELMPLWKSQNEIWCMPYLLWTVPATVLKFHLWIPHGKIVDPFFFLVRVISLSGVMPLWKNENEILSARYLKKYLSWGLETWSADRGSWLNLKKKIHLIFLELSPFENLGFWKNQNEIFSARYLKNYLS